MKKFSMLASLKNRKTATGKNKVFLGHARITEMEEDVMRRKSTLLIALIVGLGAASSAMAAEASKDPAGREVMFNKGKGNCLACHAIPNDPKAEAPGNIGPPFIMMKQRFPDREKLRAQIWDPTMANPRTAMPPFGKHQILTEQEIDQVVDYILSL